MEEGIQLKEIYGYLPDTFWLQWRQLMKKGKGKYVDL